MPIGISKACWALSATLFAPGFYFIASAAAVGAAGVNRPDSVRPNFLVIVADDLGWGDVGWHGSKTKTPNLDRLAREGIELDQHYVAPMCTPTPRA